MKKLIITAAIVCAAVSSQAAALAWASVPVTADGDEFSGGQAYLIMISDTSNFNVADNLAITGGSIVDSSAIDGSSAGGAWTPDEGVLTGGQTYYFAVLCTSAGTGAKDESKNYIMPTSGFYGVDNNGDNVTPFYEVTWNGDTGGEFNPNWGGDYYTYMNTAVAPEPTSGLLLLLGVAGLALRRRRA